MVDSTTLLTAVVNIQASLELMMQNDQEKMDANLTEIKEDVRTNQAEADTNLKEMKEELMPRLETKIEAEIKTNNENFEVIHSTLFSLMDIHQDRTESIEEEIIAQVDTHQERIGASVNAW